MKVLPWLQLVRLPNLFTAMADVLAGYLIVAGGGFRWSVLGLLLFSTSCLYAGGCVLNDLRDAEVDRRERPFRPIPSGRIRVRPAATLCGALFGFGLAAAFAAGGAVFLLALGLAGLIVAYDVLLKDQKVLGPVVMGGCRAANLLLGMAPGFASAGMAPFLSVISFFYVFLLTRLSRFEVGGARQGALRWMLLGWLPLPLGLLGLIAAGGLKADAIPFLILLVLFTTPSLVGGITRPGPSEVGKAVKMLVLGLPVLDAVYAAGVQGWPYGIPVLLLLIPSLWLARLLYVT